MKSLGGQCATLGLFNSLQTPRKFFSSFIFILSFLYVKRVSINNASEKHQATSLLHSSSKQGLQEKKKSCKRSHK